MIAYGRNTVLEAVKCGLASHIYIKKGANLYDATFNLPVSVVGKEEFDGRFGREAQGLAAEVTDIATISLDSASIALKEERGIVVLDRIQDPHNYGAIIRSSHCFGLNYVAVPRYNQAHITGAVCKASAGAIFYTKVIEETNLSVLCTRLKKLGFKVIACDMDGELTLREVRAQKHDKIALVLGAEGHGVRESLREATDCIARIEMASGFDSLNVAQSASIALYELFS
ncbi:hypothetical protein RsTz2092_07990 [Deferribacterales bacterium RsTz2092]|nr:hypothetical protein AGMMS49941_10530 [Deferribacterales bacterium]